MGQIQVGSFFCRVASSLKRRRSWSSSRSRSAPSNPVHENGTEGCHLRGIQSRCGFRSASHRLTRLVPWLRTVWNTAPICPVQYIPAQIRGIYSSNITQTANIKYSIVQYVAAKNKLAHQFPCLLLFPLTDVRGVLVIVLSDGRAWGASFSWLISYETINICLQWQVHIRPCLR